MATTTKLQLKFGTMSGVKTWTFANADPNVTSAKVKSLVNAMIAYGDLYKYPPLTAESAKLVTTSETSISID